MAILVRLDDLLHARRMTLTELAARIDITVANLSILKTGKAKAIRFSTLEAICAALEGLRLIVAAIAAAVWEPGKVDAFSFAPWLAVLLLFVLAGVFAHGARMRADLEGTV